MRGVRHDALKLIDSDKKARLLTEDDVNSLSKQIDSLMTEYKNKVDQSVAAKEKEVMTI